MLPLAPVDACAYFATNYTPGGTVPPHWGAVSGANAMRVANVGEPDANCHVEQAEGKVRGLDQRLHYHAWVVGQVVGQVVRWLGGWVGGWLVGWLGCGAKMGRRMVMVAGIYLGMCSHHSRRALWLTFGLAIFMFIVSCICDLRGTFAPNRVDYRLGKVGPCAQMCCAYCKADAKCVQAELANGGNCVIQHANPKAPFGPPEKIKGPMMVVPRR